MFKAQKPERSWCVCGAEINQFGIKGICGHVAKEVSRSQLVKKDLQAKQENVQICVTEEFLVAMWKRD